MKKSQKENRRGGIRFQMQDNNFKQRRDNMRNLIELIDLGVPLGMGIYIGYEFIRMLAEVVSRLITIIIKKLSGDEDK